MTNGEKTLGLAVITKNEGSTIERCLQSVNVVHQKIVVDSGSTDETVEKAKRCGAQVISRPWNGYSEQKQFAMDQLTTDWILILDGDEFLAEDTLSEIQNILKLDTQVVAYRIPRYHFFLRRIIKFGKGVDFPLRLLRNGSGRYTTRAIHEEIEVKGEVGFLKSGMIHWSSPTINQRLEKIKRDTDMELQYKSDAPITFRKLFIQPFFFFISYTFKKSGWRDGLPGLILIGLFSFQLFLLQAKFFECSNGENSLSR